MAATASAYRNSEELKSGNFAPSQPSPLVRRIDSSRLPGRLSRTLRCLVVVSRQGPDFWASTFAVRIESGVSYRTVQRHIDELERMKVLQKKHEANSFVPGFGMRRTCTYALHPEAGKHLAARETFSQWRDRNRRNAPSRFRPQRASHSSRVTGTTAQQSPAKPTPVPITAAEVPSKSASATHERAPRSLTPREGRNLVKAVQERMEGITERVQVDGLSYRLKPDDPRYFAPMSEESALVSACMALGIPYDSAKEHLKRCRKPETEGSDD
jgi:hypothetical protein